MGPSCKHGIRLLSVIVVSMLDMGIYAAGREVDVPTSETYSVDQIIDSVERSCVTQVTDVRDKARVEDQSQTPPRISTITHMQPNLLCSCVVTAVR